MKIVELRSLKDELFERWDLWRMGPLQNVLIEGWGNMVKKVFKGEFVKLVKMKVEEWAICRIGYLKIGLSVM